jgi:four helix bundle protein
VHSAQFAVKVWRFEDLTVWQRSKDLAVRVHQIAEEGSFARNRALRDQIQRASTSVMSNIAEGFERESRAEFARFLMIAKGSAGEVRSQVQLARELGYLRAEQATELSDLTLEVTKMIIALRKTLRPPPK